MTSQIAVFNLECVAVASDSVLTIANGRQQRTLSSSEKVFDLGPAHRVVVLGSGEARFMSVPWSLLLQEWSSRLAQPLDRLSDYAADLVAWLGEQEDLFPEDVQEDYFSWLVHDYFSAVRRHIIEALAERDLEDAPWDSLDVQRCVDEIVEEHIDRLRSLPERPDCDEVSDAFFVSGRQGVVAQAFDRMFHDLPRTVRSDDWIRLHIPALILGRHERFSRDSVIAFVGYGNADLYPGNQAVEFQGLINRRVRCRVREATQVTPCNSSLISSFAQADAINTFLDAYHVDFLDRAHRTLDAILDEHLNEDDDPSEHDPVGAALDESEDDAEDDEFVEVERPLTARERAHRRLQDDFDQLSWERFVSPMLATVDSLPRADMARMAEALVGIQALRAASGGAQPTVGGPIDVAVISRAHGVQWLRRKELTLN